MSEATDLVEKEENLPAELMEDLYGEAGEGFEDTTADDYSIPYLAIAQSNSPQLKESNGKFIDGLKQGNVFDTVDGTFWKDVTIIPVHRERFFVEWVPRDSGGGFVDRHPVSSDILSQTTPNELGRDILPNGNEIIDTVYLYALIVGEDGMNRPIVISFARTSMKKYKNLMSRAHNLRLRHPKTGQPFNPALRSHQYTLKTVVETSRKGDEYYNWELVGKPELVTDPVVRTEAKSLMEAVQAGTRGAAEPEDDYEGPASKADDVVNDDDPF
jgi:hypothetical protein